MQKVPNENCVAILNTGFHVLTKARQELLNKGSSNFPVKMV